MMEPIDVFVNCIIFVYLSPLAQSLSNGEKNPLELNSNDKFHVFM